MQNFKPSARSGQARQIYSNGQTTRDTPGVSQLQRGSNNTSNAFAPSKKRSAPSLMQDQGFSSTRNDSAVGQTSSREHGTVASCAVEFVDVVDLPALETGQRLDIFVREGDEVPTGKVIAKINDVLYRHQRFQALTRYKLADTRSQSTTSIEDAEQQYKLAKVEYEIVQDLAKKGARSPAERRRAKFELSRASLRIEAATDAKGELGFEADLELARADEVLERIKRHEVVSRFDGNVIEMFKHAGEWVTAGEPIAKIARMDRVFVQGLISNQEFNPADVKGKDVVVTVKLARNQTMDFDGKIVIIGAADSGSGEEFFIKAEVVNRLDKGEWILRKDARVTMRIKL